MKKFLIKYVNLIHRGPGCIRCTEVRARDEETALLLFNINYPNAHVEFIQLIPEPADTYRDAIMQLIDKQRAKGLEKYGQTLEDNTTLTNCQRIEHAQEELVDALQYLEHLKQTQADRLTANDYQRAALRTVSEENRDKFDGHGPLLDAALGLGGEAGECLDIVKKALFQGHELDREHLIEELGDVAWYLAFFCDVLHLTLEEVMKHNIDKLKARYPDGFDKARSVNRKEAADNG